MHMVFLGISALGDHTHSRSGMLGISALGDYYLELEYSSAWNIHVGGRLGVMMISCTWYI